MDCIIVKNIIEQVNIKNSRNLNLVGNYVHNGADGIIIMSHGFTGDKSEGGRFDKIASGFQQAGYDTMAFDFSGSGESDDDSLTVKKQVDDLDSVIQFIKQKNYHKIILFGHSLGGLVSFRDYSSDIYAIIATAPVTDKYKKRWEDRFSQSQIAELRETGKITYLRNKGIRRKIIIDGKLLREREQINQSNLLTGINCPVLILHGDKDDRVPLSDSQNAVKLLPNGKLHIINDMGHDLQKLDEVIKISIDWLKSI